MPRLVIIVVTSAGFLSASIHLTQDFADGRRFAGGFRPADVEAGEIDAAAHGAGADHPHLSDRQYRGVLRHVGDLPDLAFGKEHVALGARLFGWDEVEERLPL